MQVGQGQAERSRHLSETTELPPAPEHRHMVLPSPRGRVRVGIGQGCPTTSVWGGPPRGRQRMEKVATIANPFALMVAVAEPATC